SMPRGDVHSAPGAPIPGGSDNIPYGPIGTSKASQSPPLFDRSVRNLRANLRVVLRPIGRQTQGRRANEHLDAERLTESRRSERAQDNAAPPVEPQLPPYRLLIRVQSRRIGEEGAVADERV